MVDVRPLRLDGLYEIRPRRHSDERGFFSETYSTAALREAGLDLVFVQDNHSYSAAKGVLRGLHFQVSPVAQNKLIRVTRGSVFDVAVDLRQGSPTFGQWEGLVLSAELWNQVLIPKGFAHGLLTLEDHTEVQYKVSAPYSPQHDKTIRFDDPAIGVEWPLARGEVQLSDKDREAPPMAEVETGFRY